MYAYSGHLLRKYHLLTEAVTAATAGSSGLAVKCHEIDVLRTAAIMEGHSARYSSLTGYLCLVTMFVEKTVWGQPLSRLAFYAGYFSQKQVS